MAAACSIPARSFRRCRPASKAGTCMSRTVACLSPTCRAFRNMPTISASTEDEIIDAVVTARAWKSPLEIMGAGSKRNFGRAVVTMGSTLDVSGLKGIVSYESEELVLTAAPGTPVAEIEAALAKKGQRLGF